MKKSVKSRLTGVSMLFAVVPALVFAFLLVVTSARLMEIALPSGGVTRLFLKPGGSLLVLPSFAAAFTVLLGLPMLALARKKPNLWLVLDLLALAGVGYVSGEACYFYYHDGATYHALVTAVMTVTCLVAFVLAVAALCCKSNKQSVACTSQAEPQQEPHQVIDDTVQQDAVANESPSVQDDAQQPQQLDVVTQRQLARLKTLLDKGAINQSQYEKLVDQFTNNK